MNNLFNEISIISFFGLIYKAINLFLSKKTDVVFFTEIKKKLVNIVDMIIMVILFSIIIYIFPLQFSEVKINNSILDVLFSIGLILFILMMSTYLLNQLKYFQSKNIFKIYYRNIYLMIIIIILLFIGVIGILRNVQSKENFFDNNIDIFKASITWSIISVIIIFAHIYDHRKKARQICWINYVDLYNIKSKYFILYASDNEHVVCGKNNKYEDNDEFIFIKIDEIKSKYKVHFEKIED